MGQSHAATFTALRRGQRDKWVYEAFPTTCRGHENRVAVTTISRDGKAIHLCTDCLVAYKGYES